MTCEEKHTEGMTCDHVIVNEYTSDVLFWKYAYSMDNIIPPQFRSNNFVILKTNISGGNSDRRGEYLSPH